MPVETSSTVKRYTARTSPAHRVNPGDRPPPEDDSPVHGRVRCARQPS